MRRLAIRPGGIGDTILSFPALEHLASSSELEVWCREEVLPLVEFAREKASIASTQIDLLGLSGVAIPRRLLDRLRAFDEIHSWYGTQRAEFREALEQVGPPVYFHQALPVTEELHAADYFASQVGALHPTYPCLKLKPDARRMVLIHPYSGSVLKNWSMDRFHMLRRLLEASGRAVEFVVAPRQPLVGARVVENLGELGQLLAGASLYIGNDSGVTHLAAACGANVLALFGPTNPHVWGPRGERVEILKVDRLEELSVDAVLDRALTKTGFL